MALDVHLWNVAQLKQTEKARMEGGSNYHSNKLVRFSICSFLNWGESDLDLSLDKCLVDDVCFIN